MGRDEVTPQELMAAVLDEESRCEAWDSEFSPNPYNPWGPAEALAIPDAVPYLTEIVANRGHGRKWAVYALGLLGPFAREAMPVLETAKMWVTIFHVDPAHARDLGLHRKREAPDRDESFASSVRGGIAELAHAASDPAQSRAHFASLLLEGDEDMLLFALDALRQDPSGLRKLAEDGATRIPVDEVRQLLHHLSDDVVAAAVRILGDLHLPEDAERVIHAIKTRTVHAQRVAEWTAGVPGSEALIERAGPLELYDLVRRRRCAGLATDAKAVRPRVLEALAPAVPTKAWNDNAGRLMDLGNAAKIVRELRDPDCLEALIEAIGPTAVSPYEARIEDVVPALIALGPVADIALKRAQERFTGHRATRIGWVIEQVRTARSFLKASSTVERADKKFSDGALEDWLMDADAYALYAEALAHEPTCKHAAVQLAWIDRGFGTPITVERIAWLRSLGVGDAMLDDLSRRPVAILHGQRSSHKARERNIKLGQAAEQAGLYPIAAKYFVRESDDGQRNVEATRRHLERVRSL